MKETKQIIVMRKDLNMRKGKMIAQGAHASLGVFSQFLKVETDAWGYIVAHFPTVEDGPIMQWFNGSFKKVCVSVNSEQELMDIYNAVPLPIPKILITDNGATEFNGIPTKTCCAIGPWWSDQIDQITGKLPLL